MCSRFNDHPPPLCGVSRRCRRSSSATLIKDSVASASKKKHFNFTVVLHTIVRLCAKNTESFWRRKKSPRVQCTCALSLCALTLKSNISSNRFFQRAERPPSVGRIDPNTEGSQSSYESVLCFPLNSTRGPRGNVQCGEALVIVLDECGPWQCSLWTKKNSQVQWTQLPQRQLFVLWMDIDFRSDDLFHLHKNHLMSVISRLYLNSPRELKCGFSGWDTEWTAPHIASIRYSKRLNYIAVMVSMYFYYYNWCSSMHTWSVTSDSKRIIFVFIVKETRRPDVLI